MTTTRRLAAILAADIAGYSTAMERDEEGTAAAVRALRREVIEPQLAEHRGRLIKTTGDGFLAEFASPIAALKCALAIQQRPDDSNGLRLRIGLNLGDVIIEEGGDVLGEGVNIAARLEGLAEPGGILVSDKIVREVEGKVEAAFEDRGEQQVKNISKPLRAYAVRAGVLASAQISRLQNVSKPLSLPDKPSIAVLPFQNMSGDPEQEYFADGMVEEILTALSRFSWLFVIARNSSFTYKGRAVDIKQVGRELGVRYVLEGSVRRTAGRVRITGQLIDAITGAHLWAERFEGSLESVFDLQDQVASSVVGAIDPKLLEAEIARVKVRPPANLDAYECFLRGTEFMSQWKLEGFLEGLRFFYKAIELDPGYARAYAHAAFCYPAGKLSRGLTDDEREELRKLVREAIRLGKEDAFALAWAGFVLAYALGETENGAELIDRALALNPNLARAWELSGWVRIWLGQPEIAIEHLARAMRLSPLDFQLHAMESATASAHLQAGRYDEAVRWAQKAQLDQPNSVTASGILATSSAMAGDMEKAQQAVQSLLQLAPGRRISNWYRSETRLGLSPQRIELFENALRKAGMPE